MCIGESSYAHVSQGLAMGVLWMRSYLGGHLRKACGANPWRVDYKRDQTRGLNYLTPRLQCYFGFGYQLVDTSKWASSYQENYFKVSVDRQINSQVVQPDRQEMFDPGRICKWHLSYGQSLFTVCPV